MTHTEHFHVLVGLAGLYLPDSNEVFGTRKEARACARELAGEYSDEGEHVTGNSRDGYTVGESHVIEITPCDDADCLRDLEE